MTESRRLWAFAAAFALPPLMFPLLTFAQTIGEPVRLTAWAVNMSNIGTGGNSTVIMQIDRWSSEAERQALRKVFFEKGPDKLLDALQDTKRVGYIRLPNSIGYDLRASRQDPLEDGGRRIIILTDRRISFQEARNQPRTIDYPFTLIEVRLNKDGTGEGRMSVATKITFNEKKNTLELENYSSEPVRLQNVKAEKVKK